MTIVSYAQNFEDVLLWRALRHIERGFYIDIGAQDPIVDSVSLAFYEAGWRGVHVEPTAYFSNKIRELRPDETVIEAAVARHEGALEFFEVVETGLSTGEEMIARKHEAEGHTVRSVAVDCVPLSQILDAHIGQEIHWLKIDVEGMEDQVIESWSPSLARPWIVLVESTMPLSSDPTFHSWEPQLLALGYEFVYFDGLNRFYVSSEHQELKGSFGPGPNVFDDFTLSGMGSAPFCQKLNAEKVSLKDQVDEVMARIPHLDQEIARLLQSLDRARDEAASERATWLKASAAWEETKSTLNGKLRAKDEVIATQEADITRLNQQIAKLEAETKAMQALQRQIEALYHSTSWRVTAPLRFMSSKLRWFARGAWAWISFKPGSRPHRVASNLGWRKLAADYVNNRTPGQDAPLPVHRRPSGAGIDAMDRSDDNDDIAVPGISTLSRIDLSAEAESTRRTYRQLAHLRRASQAKNSR